MKKAVIVKNTMIYENNLMKNVEVIEKADSME
jgi:hypothetical protein